MYLTARPLRECAEFLAQHGYDPKIGMNLSAMKLAFDAFMGRRGCFSQEPVSNGVCVAGDHVMAVIDGRTQNYNGLPVDIYIEW